MNLVLVGIIIIVVCIYFWGRNNLVYTVRVNVLHDNHKYYHYLPSYSKMYFKYWYVWSEEKFLQMAKEKYDNEHSRVE